MIKFSRLLFLLFIIFYNTSLSSSAIKKADDKKQILVLHSYHSGMTWVESINKAIIDIIKPEKSNYIIHTEYMDSKRYNTKSYYESLKEFYKNKYRDMKFDIILSCDNNAFDFLLDARDEIFGDTPISFCGVNDFKEQSIKNISNITGVAENFSVYETVDIILKLHKGVKNIFIINDYLETGLAWKKNIKKDLASYEDRVKFTYSSNLSLEDLRDEIANLSSDTVVLLGVYYADKNKKYITYEVVGEYLLQASSSPVYCLLNFNVANDVVGGKVIGGYTQGERMSKIALRILNGEDASSIAVENSQANEFVFNYKGLKKHNIDEAKLPKDSKIINKPFSLYEKYKTILFYIIALFVTIITLFAFFLFYLKIAKKTNQKDMIVINIIRFSPIFFIPLITAILVWLFIYSANENLQDRKYAESQIYIENMKLKSKLEVDRFVQIAQHRFTLKYDNKEMVKSNLLSIASGIRYGDNGYIIVGSMDGIMLQHPQKELIGARFEDAKYIKAKRVFDLFKEKIDAKGRGFVSYMWENPTTKENEEKLTYVNYIPELNWYVASGVYLDELDIYIEDKLKQDALYDEKNINIIILASVVLLVFSLILSIAISAIIKNIFIFYKKSILLELQKIKEVEKSKEKYQHLANTDSLTKAHNRFSIMQIIDDELLYVKETSLSLSILMFDLDHFKKVNDMYGHSAGDSVLSDITKLVKENLRDADKIGRYGGEEFLVILPNTNLNTAKIIADRIREKVELFDFKDVAIVTISIGVIEVFKDETKHELLKRVDGLLYQAKDEGRNRVCS
jgi:diguanylate cyclase (GGDEF)-like protein